MARIARIGRQEDGKTSIHRKLGKGIGRLALIADGLVIGDPNVATTSNDSHVVHLVGYLNIRGLTLTRLLDSKCVKPDCMRLVR